MTVRILIIEDDATFRSFLQTILVDEGYEVSQASEGGQGLELLRRESFDLVISDLRMPKLSGLDLYREISRHLAPPPFIMLTAYGTIEEAVMAMKEGVADFLTKPLKDPESLRTLVKKVLASNRRDREYQVLKEREKNGLPPEEIVFAGQAMADVRRLVGEVASTGATVMITGESGTGKELVARMVHMLSLRREAPFIAINCAAVPENLMESELFGHEKGAFTGAIQARRGKFELAQGGTLFLDEIGEMPLMLQAKLLRVLQERTFERVGGTKEIRADIRVIAATNRTLTHEIQERRFREDLYYRLNVFPIHLPPLRERKDALPRLIEHFVRRFATLTGKKVKGVEGDALAALIRYSWPGNVRELQNVVERGVILGKDTLGLKELPQALVSTRVSDGEPLLQTVEREAIMEALKSTGGNRRETAAKLGISRRTLQYRLKEYGLLDNDES